MEIDYYYHLKGDKNVVKVTYLSKDEAAEVVRCKDCKFWQCGTVDEQDNLIPPKCAIQTSTWDSRHADDFCSWAVRRKDNEH